MGNAPDRFGPFVFDRQRMTVTRDGKAQGIGSRGAALLGALIDAGGTVVSKERLFAAAWPDSIVEDANLTVQIATLRKVLGGRTDGKDWIATVSREGYRLIADEDGSSHVTRPSIAVLPFANLSSDPEQDYFADGIVEDLITALSRFHSIHVTARNSSFVFKGKAVDIRDVAKHLRVHYVLEGSVRRSVNSLRITAQLIEGETGEHLWAERFDGPLEDIFAMQDKLTAGVVSIVEPLIQRAEIERRRLKPPSSLSSYDLYLQALSLALSTEPGANERAVALIERSLAIDPDFPPALAMGASIEIARFDRQQAGASDAARRRGLDYAHRALRAGGTDATTRAVAGLATIILGYEYDAGMAALRQAVADNPNSANVLGYAGAGAARSSELEEAERYTMRAIELNPADFTGQWQFVGMAHIRLSQRRFEDAVIWSNKAMALSATNPITLWFLIASLAHLGRLDEAARWQKRLLEVLPNCTLTSIRAGQAMRNPAHLDVIIEGLRTAGLPE